MKPQTKINSGYGGAVPPPPPPVLLAGSALLEALLQNATDLIYFKDRESRFVRFSNSFLTRFGMTRPDELEGKTDFDCYTEEHARPAFEAEQDIIRTGQPAFNLEEKEIHRDGRVTWVLTSKMPWRDEAGNVIGTMGISKDITEHKRAEAALLETNALLEALLRNTTDHIYFKDRESRFVYFSQSVLKHFRLTQPDELKGKTDFDFFDEKHARPAFEAEQEIIRTGTPVFNLEEREIYRDGKVTWVLTSKMPWLDKAGNVTGIMGISKDITERKRAEAALLETNALLEALLQNTTDHIYFKDRSSRFVHFSQSLLKHFHLDRTDELKGKIDFDFFAEKHARPAFEAEQEIIRTGIPVFNLEERETHGDGRTTWVLTSKMPWRDKAGNVIGTMGISKDITARKLLEARMVQSQQMETVGKLAGGVAHEFNSILTAIIGQSDLLLEDLPAGDPLLQNVSEISLAANRAAGLTRQLLAYGCRQILRPEIFDLNQIIAGLEMVLRTLMGGPTVSLNIVTAPGLQRIKADAGQIEQVILNLIMNAHDAMPNGGNLTLETANVSFDQDSVEPYPELKPGDYVMLAISDTGTGMSAEVKAHAFEPFFTTKAVGQGTGLGLSTCYGIIKQSGGHISVYSEPGRGTTFKIYLPQIGSPAKIPVERPDSSKLPRGTETILLVEDDPALREMAAVVLRRLGYTVLAAGNGIEALSLTHYRETGHIDLLFTDMVMPHMSGKELADRIRALHPHTRILFTSAYTERGVIHQGALNKGVELLQKPFTPTALAHKLREILDSPFAPNPDPG